MLILLIKLLFSIRAISSTIDLNLAELQYLADHLEPQECRKLVAAAHFKSYEEPGALGQAENKIPKEIPCLQHLLHWNSAEGEGKGETHEVLEHRLRQMGKYELADWLGKTVFRELGHDLESKLKEGLQDLVNETSTTPKNVSFPTLEPIIQPPEDPTEWSPVDTILYTILVLIILATFLLCCKALFNCICRRCAKRKQRNLQKRQRYEMVENSSSESEDRFDARNQETTL